MPDDPRHAVEYDETHMAFLELVWGKGFLSPGGPAEVERIVSGLDLKGARILDLGCGSGGVTLHLAKLLEPALIQGFDVEQPAIDRARLAARAAGLEDIAKFERGDPGPLPFENASFDLVFSKDAIVHIADKHALAREIFRVLKPGGIFAASDWLVSHDGEPSADMRAYLTAEGLSFGMASPQKYADALASAGFERIALENRNGWYREEARRERERLTGELYQQAVALVGKSFVDKNIATWTAIQKVLDSGEHCPTHLRAFKPGARS